MNACFSVILALGVFSGAAVGAVENLPVEALPLNKLANDKEVYSKVLDGYELESLRRDFPRSRALEILSVLRRALEEASQNKNLCDLTAARAFRRAVQRSALADSDPGKALKIMRAWDLVDDILYKIMGGSLELANKIQGAKEGRVFVGYPRYYFTPDVLENNDVDKLFGVFKAWPDGQDRCLLDAFKTFVSKVNQGRFEPGAGDISFLNDQALRRELIDLDQFKTLQILGSERAWKRDLALASYLEKLSKAKNSMAYSPAPSLSEVRRLYHENRRALGRLPDREALYKKYSAPQMAMLAKILEKASMRMGVDPTVETESGEVVVNYVIRRDGDVREVTERYVLSPSEQFSYARKRLRMDMMDLTGSTVFKGVEVSYADIVASALETGYIHHGNLAHVLRYDDLWNPNVSAWKKYKDFLWNIADTGALYLPAPWNVVGAIGLTFVNMWRSNAENNHEEHENPANIFD